MKSVLATLLALVIALLIGLIAGEILALNTEAYPSLTVTHLGSPIMGHRTISVHSSTGTYSVSHSDNIDTSCDVTPVCRSKVLKVSVDYPGPARITLTALDSDRRVSNSYTWKGEAQQQVSP